MLSLLTLLGLCGIITGKGRCSDMNHNESLQKEIIDAQRDWLTNKECKCPKCRIELSRWTGSVCSCGFDVSKGRYRDIWDRLGDLLDDDYGIGGKIFKVFLGLCPLIVPMIIVGIWDRFSQFLLGMLTTCVVVALTALCRSCSEKKVLKYAGYLLLYLLGVVLLWLAVKYCWPILLIGIIAYYIYDSIKDKK